MSVLAVVLALLTATGNASALVLQRKAAQDAARERGGVGVSLRDVARRPAWIAGIAIFVVAVSVQTTALSLGSIALVQPVIVMGLPATLLLGWVVLGGALRRYEWTAITLMSVGLVVLLVSLRPRGGDALGAGTTVWLLGSAATLAVLGLLYVIGHRRRGVSRAALFGIAAGMGSGFVAVIIKAMSEALARGGLGEVVVTWQSALLLPTAPLAFLALQHALRAGRLIASQPGLILCNPLLSSFWGVALLGEELRGGVAVVGGALGAAALTVGVFRLARSPLLAAQEEGPSPATTGVADASTADTARHAEDDAAAATPTSQP